jgi:acylphosphatase
MELAGVVQGIGYRHFLRQHALRLGISGWVRNLSSGNVEFAAQGAPEAIDEFLACAREGPPGAVVKQAITLTPPAGLELPTPFTILR